jgi:hypothetical protein
MTRCAVLLCVLALVAVTGCGKSADVDREKTVPVTGVVTYNGTPVAEASVGLVPDAPPGPTPPGRGAFGRTDAQGRFELMTFVAGDGAVPGNYKVTVTKVEGGNPAEQAEEGADDYDDPEAGGGQAPQTKHLLPEKYADFRKSDLTASIPNSGPVELKFDLTD